MNVFQTPEWADVNEMKSISNGCDTLFYREEKLLFFKMLVAEGIPSSNTNLIKQFRKLKGIKIFDTTFIDGKLDGWYATEKATVIIDLTKSLDELWKSIDKKRRYDIKKAKDITIEWTTIRLWEEFYQIYSSASKSWNTKPLPQEFFKRMKHFPFVRLFVATFDGKIVAGAVVLLSESIIIFYINASISEEKYANSLLVWEIIKYGKENGFKFFDLFGYDLFAKPGEETYGINKFKESFGGEIVRFNKYSTSRLFVVSRYFYNHIRLLKRLYSEVRKCTG